MNEKCIIGLSGILCVTGLQIAAWIMGFNGQVFALTGAVIGGVVGYFLGWERNVKQTVQEYIEERKHEL